MKWKRIGSGVAGIALLALSSTLGPAQARHGGHFGGMGVGHHFAGHHFVGHPLHFQHDAFPVFHRQFGHHRFHRHQFLFVAGYPYYYPYYYDDSCYWLRRHALYTGSPYWWNRYYACRYGYGY